MTKLPLLTDADYVALAFIQNRSAERASNYGWTRYFAASVTRDEQNYMRKADQTDASNLNMLARATCFVERRSSIETWHRDLAGLGMDDREYLQTFGDANGELSW